LCLSCCAKKEYGNKKQTEINNVSHGSLPYQGWMRSLCIGRGEDWQTAAMNNLWNGTDFHAIPASQKRSKVCLER
jgi:hypothetical protein